MLMQAVETPFKRAVFKEKNRYIRVSAREFERNGSLSDRSFDEHQANMQAIFTRYDGRIIKYMRAEVLEQNKVPEKKAATWETFLRGYYLNFGADKAKEVAGTTRNDIRAAILKANASDVGEAGIIKNILRTRGISAFRSDAIARTETHNAGMFASITTARTIELENDIKLLKRWNPTLSDRTREEHADMASSPAIALDELFEVGGEMLDRPGDGSPENAINCKCILTYETI